MVETFCIPLYPEILSYFEVWAWAATSMLVSSKIPLHGLKPEVCLISLVTFVFHKIMVIYAENKAQSTLNFDYPKSHFLAKYPTVQWPARINAPTKVNQN